MTVPESPLDPPLATPQKGSSSFVGSVLMLSGGAVFAQVVGFLCLPVIARLFDPEAWGVAAFFGSISGIITIATCLRYELAILLPQRDEDAASLFVLGCLLVCGFAALTAAAVGLFGSTLLGWVGTPGLEPYKWLLPVNVLLAGLAAPLQYWNIRHGLFRRLATRQVLAAAFSAGVTMIGGFLGFQTGGFLVMATVATSLIVILTLGWPVWRHDRAFIAGHCSLADMGRMARRYSRFPLVDMWSAVVNTASASMPSLLLTPSLGLAVVGLYGRAWQLVAVPMQWVCTALGQVFFQRSAAKHAAGEPLGPLVEEVQSRLLAFSLLPVLVVAVIGPDIITILCGPQWTEAGVYAQILVPWLFMVAITSPLTTLINTLERLGVGLAFNVIVILARIGALVAGGWYFRDARWALFLCTVVGTIAYFCLMLYLLRAVHARPLRLLRHGLKYTIFAMPAVIAGLVTKWWLGLSPWLVVASVAAASIVYCLLALRDDKIIQQYVGRAVERLKAMLASHRSTEAPVKPDGGSDSAK